MDAVSPSRVRIVLLAIIAVAIAAVWMILVELFSPSAAHADATRSGLGDDLVGVVEEVTAEVAPVAETVEAVVAPTVQHIEAVPPQVIAPAVEQVVERAVEPVRQVVDDGPATAILTPTANAVVDAPIVGKVTEALGLDTVVSAAVGTVAATVDETAAGLVTTVSSVTESVTDSVATPTTAPNLVPGDGWMAPAPPLTSASAVAGGSVPGGTLVTALATSLGALGSVLATAPEATFLASGDAASPFTLSASPLGVSAAPWSASSSSLTGPGGSGPALWALLIGGAVLAHRAWVRRHAWPDDALPAGPAGKNDVSPD